MSNLFRTLLIGAALTVAGAGAQAAAPGTACNRACLEGLADDYVDAMIARAPDRLPWADIVRYAENNVPMPIGEGIWATATAKTASPMRFADVANGEVAWFGEIKEHGQPAFVALRLKVRNRRIVDAEAVVRRDGGPPQYSKPEEWKHDPAFAQAAADRPGRARLIAAVNGYFDALEGKAVTPSRIDPACARLDNGVATTAGATAEGGVEGCEAQFKAGVFKPVSRVRARLYPLVDEERGVVIATGFLDLPSLTANPTTGKPLSFITDYPYSLGYMAAFKIQGGRVYRIDSISQAQPYRMPTPWGPSN